MIDSHARDMTGRAAILSSVCILRCRKSASDDHSWNILHFLKRTAQQLQLGNCARKVGKLSKS